MQITGQKSSKIRYWDPNPLFMNCSTHLYEVFGRYWRIFVTRKSVIGEFITHDKESISSGPNDTSGIGEYPLLANPLLANSTVPRPTSHAHIFFPE